ncbi:hypothetical protein BD626DRAFT_565237 [Schizophyllum amplum]|uniref:F-box domain-containing protein n=1 Tax=Schizophyllum amplum TaxID=97359 RepID=A0A550CUD7_9AGAR|nr:hypothetical protein BD626DRAFT_565237 [Auriculariopsis ampla]
MNTGSNGSWPSPTPTSFRSPPPDLSNPYIPPINRLPICVFARFFAHSACSLEANNALNREFVPLRLTHVCAPWRDFAVNMPWLWKRFALRACVGKCGQAQLAALCMERARGGVSAIYKDLVLEEYIGMQYWVNDFTGLPSDTTVCHCVFDFLVRNLEYIKELDLAIGQQALQRIPALRTNVHAPSHLEVLRLAFLCDITSDESVAPLYQFAPLRKLGWIPQRTLNNVPRMLAAPFSAPWGKLVVAELRGTPITRDAFMNIMYVSDSLQSLCVHIIGGALDTEHRPRAHRIIDYIMRTLHLEGFGSGPLDDVLAAMTLPNLRCFSLRATSAPFVAPGTLVAFLRRVKGGLETFRLSPCSESDLMACIALPQMSKVIDLSAMGCSKITERLIHVLQPGKTDSPPLLPELKILSLATCNIQLDGVVAQMLKARQRHGYALQDATIHFGDETKHTEDIKTIDEYRIKDMDMLLAMRMNQEVIVSVPGLS